MDVRLDVYSWSKSPEKQEILNGLANLAYRSYSTLFSSEDELIKYVNNFTNPEIAERFLEIRRFYHYAKFYYCPKCFPTKRIDKCPNCGGTIEIPSYYVLIMIFSIIEHLSLGLKEYVSFYDWIGKKETKRKYEDFLTSKKIKSYSELIKSLRSQWRDEYGSTTNVTEFFDKFLTKTEKIQLIKSIRFLIEVPALPLSDMENIEGKTREQALACLDQWEKQVKKEQQIVFKTEEDIKNYVKIQNNKQVIRALPICFNENEYWTCYGKSYYGQPFGYCLHVYDCRLFDQKQFRDKCLRKIIKMIYNWRSIFVHEAKQPPIRETVMLGGTYKKRNVIVELTTAELKPLFERMLKKYFNQYQK